mmetsp:Transcript_24912/g.38397  ORF Transcript_24912/g.38397 Transcript_24912/m.38397 type:complete len:300 (-) Transcript_24912:168-1067(-)
MTNFPNIKVFRPYIQCFRQSIFDTIIATITIIVTTVMTGLCQDIATQHSTQTGPTIVFFYTLCILVNSNSHSTITERFESIIQRVQQTIGGSSITATSWNIAGGTLHKFIGIGIPYAITGMLKELIEPFIVVSMFEQSQQFKFGILFMTIHLGTSGAITTVITASTTTTVITRCGIPRLIVGIVILVFTNSTTFVIGINVSCPHQIALTCTFFIILTLTSVGVISSIGISISTFNILIAINPPSYESPCLLSFIKLNFSSFNERIGFIKARRTISIRRQDTSRMSKGIFGTWLKLHTII